MTSPPFLTEPEGFELGQIIPLSYEVASEAEQQFQPELYLDNCFATDDPHLVLLARQLTAKRYLDYKFITQDQIGEDGTIKEEFDPYHAHSTYYVKTTEDGESIIASLRTIKYDPSKGKASFPVLEHEAALYKENVNALYEVGHSNLVEVSALVANKELDTDRSATLQLYKRMMMDEWSRDAEGKTTLIMACNPKLYEGFSLLFDGSMQRMGPDLPYPGQDAIPAMFKLNEGGKNIIEISRDPKNHYRKIHEIVVNYFLAGTQQDGLHPDIIETLKSNNYSILADKIANDQWDSSETDYSQVYRSLKIAGIEGKIREKIATRKPEIAANVALAGYTVARTVGVAQGVDPVADTNWGTFLAIELATQIPYAWGFSDIIRGSLREDYPRSRKLLASAAIGSAFAGPYVYLAANGATENLQSNIVAGAMLAVSAGFLGNAVKKIKQKYTKNRDITPET